MLVKLIAAMALSFMLLLTVKDTTASPSRAMPKHSSASALYKDECGSCHLAFAPSLARTVDWLRITSSLSRHFGSDASVSPQSLAMLETYFKTYGSNREKYKFAPGSLRISDSPSGDWRPNDGLIVVSLVPTFASRVALANQTLSASSGTSGTASR